MISSANVVVVDDDLMSLRVLAEALALIGVSCTTIQRAVDVSDTLQSMNDVDIIFLDLEMPELDGYSLLRILKEELQIASPIVAYTVHTNEINNARLSGFNGFLGKPLRLNRFQDQLDRILSGEGVWEAD
jgi:two-component system, cell cycle response regulator DivK